jgi:crotonobetainyl-CoA:carnitine CoA-transferase CaiB-like acyl-CoA transferase
MLLDGVRVLDLTQYLAGPSATQMLGAVGADVIKVEPAPDGDPARRLPAVRDGRSGFFVQQNRGKRSLCVDLGTAAGCDLVRRLAAEVDVVVENFGPGVLERRDLSYPDLAAVNPSLVMASISAFGRTGSLAHLPGYDVIGQAFSGVMALTGEIDGGPLAAGAALSDCSAGMMAFAAIGHALFHRERTGEGQYIDVSLVEPLFHMHALALQGPSVLGPSARLHRRGRHHGAIPPTGCFKGPQGWIVIQVLDRQWDRFCEAVGPLDLVGDPRFNTPEARVANREELAQAIEEWMAGFASDQEVLDRLAAHRCPAAPVIDPADAGAHPWFRERGALRTVQDPVLGPVDVPGLPARFSSVDPHGELTPAPALGAHNAEVLTELLGLDSETIAELAARGVLGGGA